MDELVTKITTTVKDINTGKTPVKINDVRPPSLNQPKKCLIYLKKEQSLV